VFENLGCHVEQLKRQIKLSYSAHLPFADEIAAITARLTAQGV
jgi:hypothetical protein